MNGDGLSREWVAAFGHELRSPIAAIVGYAELVQDGALGHVDPRAADAVHRMAAAAEQLIALLDGVDAAMDGADGRAVEVDPGAAGRVAAADMITEAVHAAQIEAQARSVVLETGTANVTLRTVTRDAALALGLALGAAVKSSPGATLRLSAIPGSAADANAAPSIVIDGSSLRPDVDGPEAVAAGRSFTGGGLRLMLANEVARRVRGHVSIDASGDGARVVLTLPEMPG